MLGISAKTLYNQVSAKVCPIPTVKIGGRRLVRLVDLLACLSEEDSPLRTPVPTRKTKSRPWS